VVTVALAMRRVYGKVDNAMIIVMITIIVTIQSNRNGTNLREQYVWVPDSCSFDLWDAQKFCTALGNRTVLIVGDSTLQQVAVTLINMIISNNGNCADKITFAKSYFLTFKKWGERKKNIFEFVEDINPDIVVFSAGAHLHDLGDLFSVMVQH
jgi:hypothetical protein